MVLAQAAATTQVVVAKAQVVAQAAPPAEDILVLDETISRKRGANARRGRLFWAEWRGPFRLALFVARWPLASKAAYETPYWPLAAALEKRRSYDPMCCLRASGRDQI
jgi:hypothetical protein